MFVSFHTQDSSGRAEQPFPGFSDSRWCRSMLKTGENPPRRRTEGYCYCQQRNHAVTSEY
jgi:hypothetical protein